jgi:hypothetical protein
MKAVCFNSVMIITAVLLHVCAVEAADYGKYYGEFIVRPEPDGRNLVMVESLTYVDTKGLSWIVPKGTKTDGASVPRFAWTLFPPFSGKYRIAAVVHDRYCQTRDRKWRAVHRMFYVAMRAAGVDAISARIMYASVYAFGPRWSFLGGGVKRGVAVAQELDDAEQEKAFRSLEAWIKLENPTPKDIERRVNKLRIRQGGTNAMN